MSNLEVSVGENSSRSDVEFELWPFVMLPEIISLNRTVHQVGRPNDDSDVC
jgi:hypothetical protein